MSLLADALLPQVVSGVQAVDRRLDIYAFADLITNPKSAYVVEFDDPTKRVRLDFRSSDFIASAVAADCSRLTISAIQSISTAEEELADRTLMPWAFIKLYYAAYYAGHSLIRLLGDGCVSLTKSHSKRVVDVANVQGKIAGFPIEAGWYRCVINTPATRVDCVRIDQSGGPHEVFWKEFVRVMSAANAAILTGPLPQVDARSAFAKLAELERMFARNGSASWLSRTRNEVQYQHAYEVWFRCGITKRDRESLARLSQKWRFDPMAIDLDSRKFETLGEFVSGCSFITSVCHDLIMKISRTGTKSFLHFGPIALLNDLAGA